MGVYYIVVNDTKKEYIDPGDFGENFKLSGIFQGVHGSAIAKMLCSTNTPIEYSYGHWAGDSIRVIGDNAPEDEHGIVVTEYNNISFYALALEFEDSAKGVRDEIIKRASGSVRIFKGLVKVTSQLKLKNLNHSLGKLHSGNT